MSRLIKGIALAFFATVLPCLGWAADKWVSVELPGATQITTATKMDGNATHPTGVKNVLSKAIGKGYGELVGGCNTNASLDIPQGDDDGEGKWTGSQMTFRGRSGYSGNSYAIVAEDSIPEGMSITKIRLKATLASGSYNANTPFYFGIGVLKNGATGYEDSNVAYSDGVQGTTTAQTVTTELSFDSAYTWAAGDKVVIALVGSGFGAWSKITHVTDVTVDYLYSGSADYYRELTGDQDWNVDWDTTVDGTNLPGESNSVVLNALPEVSLTMDATAKIASLETLGDKITFAAGDSGSLTSTTTTINADTDVSAITSNLGTVTVAGNKTLTIDDSTTITSATEGSTIKVDGTVESKELSATTLGALRTANGKIIALGSGETGVALPFAISTAAAPNNTPAVPALNNRIIFSGGKHTMQAGHTNNWNVFTNLMTSYEDPLIWVKDNASLEFTMRDSSGGINTVSAGRALRVDAGSTLTFKSNGTNTGRFAEQLHLCGGDSEETGAKLVIDNNGLDSYFYIHGSDATETMSNIVVPGSESATYASITGGTILSDSSAAFVTRKAGAMNIGANATLHVANPIGGSAAFYKFGAGTLKLSGLNTITGQVEVEAGTLELAATTLSGDDNKTFADSRVINTAENTTVKLTSGGGYFNIQGAGTVVADGGANFIYGMGNSSRNTISANLVVPADAQFNVRAFSGCQLLSGGNITVNGSIIRNGGDDGALKVTVASGKTLSGNGTISVPVTLAAGATINASTATAEKCLTLSGGVTLPKTGTVTIDVDGLTAETTILSCAASTLDVSKIELVNATEGLVVKTNDAGTALVLAAVPVVSAGTPLEVDTVPTEITLNTNSFGYGEHTVLTYTGTDTPNWNTLTTINGLPDGVTEDDIVTTETTWGFTNKTLKVLPIGDSITAGLVTYDNSSANWHVAGGYRLPLYQYLEQAGYDVTYLGTSTYLTTETGDTSKNSYEDRDIDSVILTQAGQLNHEGHSGATIDGLNVQMIDRFNNQKVLDIIATQGTPDVITLHLGTNDIGMQEQAADVVFAEMKHLLYLLNGSGEAIEGVTPRYPNATVFVAKIIPRADATAMTTIDTFNTSLANYVETCASDKLVLVDLGMEDNFGLLRHDGLHPSTEGYSRMAQNWFAAIEATIDPLDADESIDTVDSRVAGRLTVTLNKAAEADGTWSLDNGATVTSATLADDKRTVTLDVTGVVSGTTYTLTATDTWANTATTTFTPADIHVPTADVVESSRAAAVNADGVLKAAEWTTFANFATGYTSPIGYMPESGRAWQLDVRGTNEPTADANGVLSLNGAPLTVNFVDGHIGTSYSVRTTVLAVSNVSNGDVIFTEATSGLANMNQLLLTADGALQWKTGSTTNPVTIPEGVDLAGDTPVTIAEVFAAWSGGYTTRLMINGAEVATFDWMASKEYETRAWSIGALSTVDTGSTTMKLHRLSFYEGNVTEFITDTTWTNGSTDGLWATDSNWSHGVPTEDLPAVIPAGSSITLGADATAKAITITPVDGQNTVAISGAYTLTVTDTIVIDEGETLKTTGTTLDAPVSGEGTLHIVNTKYHGRKDGEVLVDVPCPITGLTDATWTGTVILEAIDGVNNLSLVDFGNADSSITLKNVTGNLDHDTEDAKTWNPITVESDIHLEGTNTLNNGYAAQVTQFKGALTSAAGAILKWTGAATGTYYFTDDVSGFIGTIDTTDSTAGSKPQITIGSETAAGAGCIRIDDTPVINGTLCATNGIKVFGTLKGAGTLASDVTIQTGATIDATDPTKILTLAEGVEVVWPDQGTLNVTVPALPTEGASITLFKQTTGLADGVKQITTLSVTPVGGETVTSGYQVEAKASVGYVLALRGKENPVYSVANEGDLTEAIAEIKKITDADVNATVNLTAALTGTTALTSTLVIDIGDTNSLTINMAGHAITAGDFTAIQLVSGQLTIASAAEAAITRTGTAGATILVAPLDTTLASPTLTLEAGVKVNANTTTSESAAVDLQIGTIGGAGTLNGNLKLAHNTTIDATIGHLTIADSGIVQFPGQISEISGGLTNSNVYVLMPEGLVYPQEIIKCANASADHAPGATLYVDDIFGNNYGLTVMLDNQTSDVSAYGLKQYVCVASTERYTTVAAAIADKQTNIYLHANPVENIVIPDGVTLNLAYLGVQYTVVGNVTVQDGGCLRPMGGDVFGNVTFDSGSTLDVAYDLQNVSTTEFIVGGKVTFPASDFVVVVGSAAEAVAIGEPRQIIRSAVPLEYSTISVTNLQIATGTDDDGDVTEENDHTKIVTTSFTYEVVNVNPGACTLDGIDYASIPQALRALADAGNDVITLNEALAPDATIVIDVDDLDTEEIEEVTIDLNGFDLTSKADSAIRIQSGKLNLVSTHDPEEVSENPQITSRGYDVIKVGADAEGAATTNAALHVDASVSITSAAAAIDVVSGTLSGNATLNGNLLLRDGAIIDASTSMLTIGTYVLSIGSYVQEVQADVTFPGTDAENKGTITVIPPAGSAYPVQFIACPGADATNYANTDLLIKMGETTSAVGEFTFDLKKESETEGAAVTGYAIATDYAVVRVDGDTGASKAYYATFEDAFVDDEDVDELETDILVLLANVAVDGTITANIYTNGYDLSGTGTISGSLTLTQGTEIPAETSISAAGIQIDADATVTINGTIASTAAIPVVWVYGTMGGTGMINNSALWLMDGATIAQGANFAPTGGTVVDDEATVTIDGTLSGSLYVPHATIEGEGAVTIGDGNTLTGAGTIEPTVTFVSGAIIDKSGFEEEHLVLSAVTALTDEVITVKATDLAHVLTAKNAEAPFTAANFTVDMGTSGYVAYNPEDPADYDNNLVIQAVAYNNGHTLGIVKLNYYIGGARIANPTNDAGVSVAKQLAAYGYRYGILEIKGIDTASSDPVAGFQLFTNVVNGFVGNYLVITYDFGVTGTTIIATTETTEDGDTTVTTVTKYVLVTADVDGVYDSNTSDTRGHADYRDTTTVELCTVAENETLTPIDEATELTDEEAIAYGLIPEDSSIPPGVKYFIVPYDTLFPAPAEGATPPPSETIKLKVKASASLSE